jgi:hypothetical protein
VLSYRRFPITLLAQMSSACLLLGWSAAASAQGQGVECRATETRAECHARLDCMAGEDLQDCQDRLRENAGSRAHDDSGRERSDREGADRAARDRSDRDARSSRDRRDRDARSSRDRRDRDARSSRDRGDRSRGDRSRRGGDRDRRASGGSSGGFQANKTFGLGLEMGAPTGVNGKYFLSDTGALDFGIGWIYRHYYYGDGLHLYLNYLWHPVSLASTSALELPLYIGIGGRFWDFDYCRGSICGRGTAVGVRVPVGISLDFNRTPLDIFFQLVPVVDFIANDYYRRFGDRSHVGIDASVGIRYWFH